MSDLKTILIEVPADPVKADAWKNLMFLRCGKALRGMAIHQTEYEARQCIANDERIMHECPYATWQAMDGTFTTIEYSHAIQIPWQK